jgi:hypothetical protein
MGMAFLLLLDAGSGQGPGKPHQRCSLWLKHHLHLCGSDFCVSWLNWKEFTSIDWGPAPILDGR